MSVSLKQIKSPRDLKKVPVNELPSLASEIREKIIDVTSKKGGHIAPSLGAVEIAIALHYLLDVPRDKILWDVGHQAYAHKLLTGRYEQFETLRQFGGISGFPNKDESVYDCFTVGHSSTSISQALGLACARDLRKKKYKVVSVIGDAALANGMALEALNNGGQMNKDVMIVLNDNEQSISKSVGAISNYLNRILSNPMYNKIRGDLQKLVKRIPLVGPGALKTAKKIEEGLKNLLVPGRLFEDLGFRYFGPIDGHNINLLIATFRNVLQLKEPRLIHVITKKGKGYKYAELNPRDFHGTSPFNIATGETLNNNKTGKGEAFSAILGRKLTELAKKDRRIVAITAAMCDGTGLTQFSEKFPGRFFDVGIAEGHAVTFSAALAKGGLKPVIAIYSTFLQRSYDQIIHDVCLQNLPVIFCVDRAGLVGEDGPTHHGMFDLAFLRHIPNLIIMAPKDGIEFENMIEFAFTLNAPVAIRYPRGKVPHDDRGSDFIPLELGRSEIIKKGRDIAIIAVGTMVSEAQKIQEMLLKDGIKACVVNARFVKPIDEKMIEKLVERVRKIVTIEEGTGSGGFGSAVLELIERKKIKNAVVKIIGLPDRFIEHGEKKELLNKYNLTDEKMYRAIKTELFK